MGTAHQDIEFRVVKTPKENDLSKIPLNILVDDPWISEKYSLPYYSISLLFIHFVLPLFHMTFVTRFPCLVVVWLWELVIV